MTGSYKSENRQEKPPVVATDKSQDWPQDGAIASTALKSPSGIEGILWPPFVTNSFTAELAMQVQLEISQWWGTDRTLSCQLAQLHNVMIHAAKTTPFYKDRLEAVLAQSKNGLSLAAFRQIPILTRNEFQNAGDSINSTAVPASHGAIINIQTSGSTGQPLTLKGTQLARSYSSVISLRYELWHRRDLSQKALSFRTLKPGESIRRNSARAPVVNAGESIRVSMAQPASTLLESIKTEDPAYIVVHPSVLKELLFVSQEQGYQPVNLKQVCTMGEILYPELRARCQRQWGVKVSDLYSCEEFGILALQCPEHPHYHVQSENVLIEVLRPDNTPCKPGEVGKTVISSLSNFATPILRYENGDMAEAGEPCTCGRGLPVLKRIIGRVRNTAVLPNGERLMPNLSTGPLLTELPIKHFQLIQKTTELIEARLVVGHPLTTSEELALANYFNRGWRHEFNFKFVYVDEITRGANGKYEVFRCEVPME